MKGTFKSFHNVNTEELELAWGDKNTLFVFDTNVLHNLYGYAKQTRDDFFKIIEKLESRIWIPHQVGLEYQRRRLEVIKNEKKVFNDIENNLLKIENTFKGDFEKLALKRRFPKLAESTEKLEKEIEKSISNYKKSVSHWNSEQPCVKSHDEIRDLLNKYFDGNVGEKPSEQDWLDKLYAEGKVRYANKIPPGFKDTEKVNKGEDNYYFDGLRFERQYGDLILWKQLLLKASDENVDNIIFITDDSKEDWWYKIDSNGKKIIGPLAELQAEIYRDSNIDKFHMYSTSSFMEDGKTNLSVVVNESSIEDAGIQHLQSVLQNDDLYLEQELLPTQQDPMKVFRAHQELLRSHQDPMKEFREHQELLRSHQDPMKEFREHQELFRSLQDPFKEHQELLRSLQDPFKELREQEGFLRSHYRKIKDDDSNRDD